MHNSEAVLAKELWLLLRHVFLIRFLKDGQTIQIQTAKLEKGQQHHHNFLHSQLSITAALTMTTKIPTATLYALVRAYVEACNTNSHIVLFASTKALPDPVKEIIKTFVQRYYMEGLRFSHDGKELTPNDITVDGGSLLATYIHSLGSYTVMLASMCQHILKDDYLKKDFVAELPPGVELSQRAWWDQKSVIKNVVSNYIADHIICPLHEGKPHHIKTSFVALKDHFSPQFVACFLSLRSRELD